MTTLSCCCVATAFYLPPAGGGEELLGVGFLQMHSETGSSHCYHEDTQPLMEAGGHHVSPARIIRMDRPCVNPHAAPQRAPGARVGAVELWDCAHPLVWAADRGHLSRFVAAAKGGRSRATALRMVLRGGAQSRRQAANPRGYDVFCPSLALGRGPVAWHAPRPGSRCDGIGRAVCRVDRQCRLSRLCYPRGVDRLARQPAPCVAPRMAADAAAGAPRP